MIILDEMLLGAIYEGPLQDEPWHEFIALLRQQLKGVATSLHLRLPGPDQRGFDISDSEWDVRVLREHYEGRFYRYNPFSYESMQPGVVYRWTDFVSYERFRRTEYYREFCQSLGFEYALCLGIDEPEGLQVWLSVVRNSEQGDFSEEEEESFQSLFPHLQRSLKLLAKIQRSESENMAYRVAMDRMAIGALVMNRRGELISVNEVARSLAERDGLFSISGNLLRLTDRSLQQRLTQVMEAMLDNPNAAATEALSLSRHNEPALGMLLRAFPSGAQLDTEQRPALMIYLSDPTANQLAPQQLVAQLFGLTPAESKLATLLADGLSVAEAAAAMHVSEGSARSYCKRIYAKTGLSRQAELVRLILKSVASLA